MAARRFYAYYIRGNQLALVEHDNVSGDGQTLGQPSLDDIGPSGGLQWKSPVASITDGLEIEYAYSPRYAIDGGLEPGVNQWLYNGWTIVDGYLTLLITFDGTEGYDGSPYTAVRGFEADKYIVIAGSNRWNGLHKIQAVENPRASGATYGGLKTYTRVNESVKTFTDGGGTWTTDETITALDAAGTTATLDVAFTDSSTTPYLWIVSDGNSTNDNTGLFSDWTFSGSVLDLSSAVRYSRTDDDYLNETSATPDFDATNSAIAIFEAFKESGAYIVTNVDSLNDENDTIDLPEYLSKALVYYVKAKLAEDQMDMEAKEYLMREFRRILEKHESSKIWGPRVMVPGSHGIR